MELILNENEIKQIETLIGEIPLKYSYPVANLLRVVAERNAEENRKKEEKKREEEVKKETEKSDDTGQVNQ